jgi:hypothetical protein
LLLRVTESVDLEGDGIRDTDGTRGTARSEESGFKGQRINVAFWVVSHRTEESRTTDCLDYALARAAAWSTETREPGELRSVLEKSRCEW